MKGESEEEQKGSFRVALGYYNKALLSLKMLFDDQRINDEKTAAKYIFDIELPVCLNLALCYIKTDLPHYGIKYSSQVIDKNLPEIQTYIPTLEKAYYRRGLCYFKIGHNDQAKSDLNKCITLA